MEAREPSERAEFGSFRSSVTITSGKRMENLSNFENRLNDAVNHFSNELKKIRVSGISAQLVEDVQVQAYGITQPLKSLASVFSVSESELNVEVYDQ